MHNIWTGQGLNSAGSRRIPDPAPPSWDPAPLFGDPTLNLGQCIFNGVTSGTNVLPVL